MKKLFSIASLAVLCMLAACGGSAQAVTLTNSFTSSDGTVFTVYDVKKVSGDTPGYIVLSFMDGSTSGTSLQDAGGVVFTKFKASAAAAASFVKLANTNTYVNINMARNIVCSAGTMTISWTMMGGMGAYEYVSDPGCAVFNSIKAAGN